MGFMKLERKRKREEERRTVDGMMISIFQIVFPQIGRDWMHLEPSTEKSEHFSSLVLFPSNAVLTASNLGQTLRHTLSVMREVTEGHVSIFQPFLYMQIIGVVGPFSTMEHDSVYQLTKIEKELVSNLLVLKMKL